MKIRSLFTKFRWQNNVKNRCPPTSLKKDKYCQSRTYHNKVQKGELCATKGLATDNEAINASCITGKCITGQYYNTFECA